jgi:protein required for attachment to host cells
MSDLANFLLPNEPTCIVACSSAKARFWLSESRRGDWRLLTELHNEKATHQEADFASDRPGRSFDIAGSGRHAMSPQVSGQDQETLRFAREVAAFLNSAIANNEATRLVLLAAPGFLGFLRSELSAAALRAIALAEPKNLADVDEDRIKKYFE